MHQHMRPSANKYAEEEDCQLVNMNVNNDGFKILKNATVLWKGNALNMFVIARGYKQ